MKYEIINPHDKYTLEAPNHATALAAVGILGEGAYGIEGNGFKAPPVPFGPDWPPEVYAACGVKGLIDLFGPRGRINTSPEFNEAVASALDTVKVDGERSSIVDLERRAYENAKALRGQRTFAGIQE